MEEIASVGIAIQTGDIERGIKSLDTLANQGPKVEKSMQGIETAVAKTGKSLATLGQGGADAGFEKVAQGSKSAAEGVNRLGVEAKDSAESMLSLTRTGIAAFLGGQIVQSANSAAKAIYEASAAGERLRTMLDFSTGGNGAREIEYLREVTAKLGLEFASTSRAYGQFQAAAKGTALEGQKARDIFESVAKASAVMGLSTEQSSGALLALQQMISKGTVQAEELRGQLGERLPGAFQIAAKAMGVTTAELGKMLEQGQVVADVFLPKFAAALEQNLGGAADKAADRLDAAVNRFDNAWERLKQSVGDSGVSAALRGELNAITNDLTVFRETMDKVRASGGGTASQFIAAGSIEAARAGFAILNGSANLLNGTINTLSGGFIKLDTNLAILPDSLKTSAQQASAMAKDLAGAEMQLAALQARGDATSENIYIRSSYAQLAQYVAKLKEAKQEQDKLAGLGQSDPRDQSKYESRSQSYAAEAKRVAEVQAAMGKVLAGLSGVKDTFLKDLSALSKGYESGLIKIDAYRQAVQKLITESGGGKVSAAAAKAEQTTYATLIATIKEKVSAADAEAASSQKLTESDKLRIKLMAELETGAKKLSAAHKAEALALLDRLAVREKDAKAIQLSVAMYRQQLEIAEEIAAFSVAESKAREAGRLAVDAYAKSIDEQNALTQVELGLVGKTWQARELALAQYRIELDLKKQIDAIDRNSGFDEAQRIEERSRARAAAAKASAGAQARVYVDEAERMARSIEQTLTDSLMRGFESGKGFAETLKGTVEAMFKTMVLRPTIESAAKQLSGGKADAIASWLPYFDAAASASAGKWGEAAGTALGAWLGNGAFGAVVGKTLGSAVDKIFSGGAGTPHMGAMYLSNGASGYVPGAGVVGDMAWGDSVYKNRSSQVEDYLKGITTGTAAALNSISRNFGGLGGFQVGGYFAADNRDASQGNIKILQGGTAVSTVSAKYSANGEQGLKEYTAQLSAEVRRTIDGIGLPDWAKGMLNAIGEAPALDQLAATVDQINATQKALGDLDTAFSPLGGIFSKVAALTGDATMSLAGFLGGLGGLDQLTRSYYDAFYSEAEKTAATTKMVADALGGLGVGMPATREAFRAIVDAQDLTTEAGRKNAAELLRLAPAFAQVTAETVALTGAADTSAKALAAAAERAAEAGRQALAGLAQDRGSLEVELLRAQGSTAAAAALELQQTLAKLTEGLNATDAAAATAAQAYNDTLRTQIEAAQAATEAQRAATEKAQAVASERYGLEGQLLQLLGDTAALRARELAALDPVNRATQERINALRDEQDQAAKTAQAAAQAQAEADRIRQAAEVQAKAVADQRFGLEGQILQLLGDTAALRQRELEALDPTNRYLQERINSIKDEQAAKVLADQAIAKASEEAAARVRALADVLANLGSTRFGLENQLLGLQGNNAEVLRRTRERDLAELTKGLSADDAVRVTAAYDLNAALQQQITDTQAAQQAAKDLAQAQAQAAADAQRAAEQFKNAWQSVADSIFDEVARIRGLISGGSASSFAASQSAFAIAAAQARAGDQEAAKLLPGLSQAMLTLAEAQATSLLELQRIRAQAAATLSGVGGSIASQYGLNVPKLATGTNYVPSDMLAVIHEGEAVVPRAYNPAAGGASSANAELLAEVKALRIKTEAQSNELIKLNARTTQIMDRWELNGLPQERTV